MFKEKIEQNLRKPKGLFGQLIAQKLKSNLPEYKEILKYLELKNGMQLFEIGYGPGYGIKYIHENYDVDIDGIDFSKLMYKKATRRTKRYKEKTNLQLGDFNENRNEKSNYDRVLILNVIYFWNNPEESLVKVLNVVKKGGIIGISIASPELLQKMSVGPYNIFHEYSIEYIKGILERHNTTVTVKEDENVKDFFYILAKKI